MATPDEVAETAAADTVFPEWVEPMAATLTQERFTHADWMFERKFDGIRLVAFKHDGDVRLYSRTRKLQHIPAVAAAIAALPVHDAILDGEMTWDRATAYHVFDIVWLNGRDLRRLTLAERRARLHALPIREPLVRVPELDDAEPWERARLDGWEGVIAKRRDSPYEHRRSKHWLKMKCELSQDFVVGGFTDPQGGRVGLGALLVGYFEGEDFVFAGKVGTGFDTALLTDLRARFDGMTLEASPFTKATGLPRVRANWVRPDIVVHVAFIEWTVHTKLRHSRLLKVRTDRPAREVVRMSGVRS
jgi:bifunctional non-homologous end joining protein LigD